MLRERQMEERKARILDAAARLLRETGGTEFSMLALAEAAAVSPKTPYNLFRSKPALLYALLNRTVDEMARETLAFSAKHPFDRALEAAGVIADVFTRDPRFMRPLYQHLLGVRDEEHRPRFMERSIRFWTAALDEAVRHRMLSAARAEQLAREILIHNFGALEFWIHEELDDDGFRAQIAYGSALLLLRAVPAAERPRIERRVRAAERRLPRRFGPALERAPARDRP